MDILAVERHRSVEAIEFRDVTEGKNLDQNAGHHLTDRGAAYTAGRYQQELQQHGLVQSLSRPANCLDNAAMESFFSSLKNERTHHEIYASRADARESVYDYIERFYNPQRMHSTLGYYSPMQFEKYAGVA
jgi:putative transposase